MFRQVRTDVNRRFFLYQCALCIKLVVYTNTFAFGVCVCVVALTRVCLLRVHTCVYIRLCPYLHFKRRKFSGRSLEGWLVQSGSDKIPPGLNATYTLLQL